MIDGTGKMFGYIINFILELVYIVSICIGFRQTEFSEIPRSVYCFIWSVLWIGAALRAKGIISAC